MQKAELGRTGLTVSRVCLGTMTWGSQNTEAEGHAQMDLAVERGVDFFDTAEMYAVPPDPRWQGETERIIGTWFKASGKRDQIVLATKIAGRSPMNWLRADGSPCRQTRAQIDEAVERSLQRLQTDWIDLYQLHWPERPLRVFGGAGNTYIDYGDEGYEPLEAILESLNRHVEAGRIRHLGVSNETPWGVMRLLAAAEARGWPRIVSIQNAYNLVNRSFEQGLAEIAMREQVGLLAYSPLAQGYLTGKYRDGALPAGARKTLYNRLQRYEGPGAEAAINGYLDLAAELGVSPSALAIKFCDAQPWVTSTIIGATSTQQLTADLDAFDLPWTAEMQSAVDRLHAQQPNPCP